MKATSPFGNNSKHLINIALFAGIFEWYEFSIFGLMAGIISQLFFVHSTNTIQNDLSVYLIFALSYFVRPLGGLFFGRMGDRFNPGKALKLSLMTMAIPTIIIGLLPTYNQIGIWSTAALCLLRLIQGFGVGGEFPNSISYILNTSPTRYKTFLGTLTCASTALGILLGAIIHFGLRSFFDEATILRWAWRIPFLLSIPLTGFIAWVRRSIDDTGLSSASSDNALLNIPSKTSLWSQLADAKYSLVTIILLGGLLTTCSNLILIWMPYYLHQFLNVPSQISAFTNTITLLCEIIVLIASGYFIYFLPVEKTLRWLHISLIILIYPLFQGLQDSSMLNLILIQCILGFFIGSFNGCFIEVMRRIIPPHIQSVSTSIVFAISPAFFGGLAPLIATWLTQKTGILAAPSFWILGLAILALPVTLKLKLPPERTLLTK